MIFWEENIVQEEKKHHVRRWGWQEINFISPSANKHDKDKNNTKIRFRTCDPPHLRVFFF